MTTGNGFGTSNYDSTSTSTNFLAYYSSYSSSQGTFWS